jgi:DNA-binding MarR family transcriptional regulator
MSSDPVVNLMGTALRRLQVELAEAGTRFGDLRGSQYRVLTLIPPGGTRLTDLAVLAGMTKQGCGQFITVLADLGYVRVRRDPTDGRARLVHRTERGDAASRLAVEAVARLERHWEGLVGPHRYATFRAVLEEVAADAPDPRG